jgi:hypothetical protein
MGKITVKHYLNTNLKAYIINGEKYYSIYALVTANRQNTKVKSIAFNEYYTERDFEEINNQNNIEDYTIIKNEEVTIINIASLILNEFETFDTTLFAAIYNYFKDIFVFELSFEMKYLGSSRHISLNSKEKNKAGLNISEFFVIPEYLKENFSNGMSLYTWYSDNAQKDFKTFLITNNCQYDIDRTIELLNKIIFYESFEKLYDFLKGQKKYEGLLEKYSIVFEGVNDRVVPYYEELSI